MSNMKRLATAGATVTFAGLALQFYLNQKRAAANGINPMQETIRFLSYMTIWTNILVFLSFLSDALPLRNRLFRFLQLHGVKTATALFIVIVGIVYHFLLSSTFHPQGLGKVANGILHYFTPVAYFAFWVLMERKRRLPYLLSFSWLIYPIVFASYSLLRGLFTHTYPYPFLDVNILGYGRIMINMLGLGGFYLIAGWILIAINNQLAVSAKQSS